MEFSIYAASGTRTAPGAERSRNTARLVSTKWGQHLLLIATTLEDET